MAARNNGTPPPDARAALAKRSDNGGVAHNDLASQIRGMEKQFQLAMPKGAEATQLIRDALTALRTSPKLAQCEAASVLGSLMTCAQLGLRPGVLGHAWLLPFWDGKSRGFKAQLVLGYQGLIELAHRSGQIKSLIARTVYENDVFDVDYGLSDNLIHKPHLLGDRGEPVAYYAVAKFVSGGHAFMVMTQTEMLRYRNDHATAKTKEGRVFGPWVDNFEGMAQKTVVRQLAKYMPKATELAVALAADEGVRVDLRPDSTPEESTEHPIIDVEPFAGPPAPSSQSDGMPAEDAPLAEWPDVAPAGGGSNG